MVNNNRSLVTYKEFTDKMNDCLHRDAGREGMKFLYDKDGYKLIAPGMNEADRMTLDKTIFDEVSKQYSIVSD